MELENQMNDAYFIRNGWRKTEAGYLKEDDFYEQHVFEADGYWYYYSRDKRNEDLDSGHQSEYKTFDELWQDNFNENYN